MTETAETRERLRTLLADLEQLPERHPTYTPSEPTPGPKDGLPAKAMAYGRYCKGESKEHVKGEKGTAFSRCVKAVVELRQKEKEEEDAV